jgi:hypothetical protein
MQELSHGFHSPKLGSLLPEEGLWFLGVAQFVLEIGISIVLTVYFPIISTIIITVYAFSFCKTTKQKFFSIIPVTYGSRFLMANIAELAVLANYMATRDLFNRGISAVRKRLNYG